jgi:hypothetical protein
VVNKHLASGKSIDLCLTSRYAVIMFSITILYKERRNIRCTSTLISKRLLTLGVVVCGNKYPLPLYSSVTVFECVLCIVHTDIGIVRTLLLFWCGYSVC